MKTRTFQGALAVMAAGGLVLIAMGASAQNSVGSTADILQLERAKVSDSTIIAYVQNSGHCYNLDASQILSLREKGVSDAVITAMLNQPKGAVATTAPVAAPAASAPAAPAPQPTYATDTSSANVPTATVAPTVTYVQTVPTTYYYAPYYYPCYGYYGPYPAVSLSFGWGGRWGGGWHGGGGWHH